MLVEEIVVTGDGGGVGDGGGIGDGSSKNKSEVAGKTDGDVRGWW